uniref:Phosphatidic acid phosphatase type 2/haloperoxidase domain-containing protein n=1 Tax=viral metagenome TaxID=1070528 RepID=A0A6C0EGI7_9ZZZZ
MSKSNDMYLKDYDYGNKLLFLLSIVFLYDKKTYLVFYVVGAVLNYILNCILKLVFKHPRPIENMKLFQHEMNRRQTVDWREYERFGMPSGHSQETAFSFIYIMMVLQNTKITLLYFIIMLFTMFQRIYTKRHFFIQVFVGGSIGLFMGYFFYYLASKYIRRH